MGGRYDRQSSRRRTRLAGEADRLRFRSPEAEEIIAEEGIIVLSYRNVRAVLEKQR